jgi:hypothetical protein
MERFAGERRFRHHHQSATSIPKNAPHPKIRRDPVILVVVGPEGLAQLRENGCTAAIFSEYVRNVFFLLLSLVPVHQTVNNDMSPPANS